MATRPDDELRLVCLEIALNFLRESADDANDAINVAQRFFRFVKDGEMPDDD